MSEVKLLPCHRRDTHCTCFDEGKPCCECGWTPPIRPTDPRIAAAPKAYEVLDNFHANCPECDGTEQPEACAKCFPLADDARLRMRAALAKAVQP